MSQLQKKRTLIYTAVTNDVDLFKVITQLLAGDEITVVADGVLDGTSDNTFLADGYTSFTGMQIRAGLE